jgi:hypothetical protein
LIVDAGGVIRRRLEEPAEADYDRLDELASAVQR